MRENAVNSSDNLPARSVGRWSEDKLIYLKKYIEIFETSMRKRWATRNYIDLFAGPGKCIVRETKKEIDGSPLIALKCKHPFTNYFFVEKERRNIAALKKRCQQFPNQEKIQFIEGDCNEKIDLITKALDKCSLNLAFIDPTGLQLHFSTLKRLVESRRVDLIIIFPQGMAINRNVEKFIKMDSSSLDQFLGDDNWRKMHRGLKNKNDPYVERAFIDYFKGRLKEIGYKDIKSGDEVLIKSTKKRLPLYYLIFASKHSLGHTFWEQVRKIEPSGQRRLF